jgi:hypothetical protein
MNLGEWLGAQARGFRERGDAERLRMMQCYVEAYQARETDPDRAFAAFTEGRRRAEQLGEPWWVLFYETERLEALLHFKRDYRAVLDLAVQAVLEVRKPANAQYPGRFGIWDCLVASYLGIDAEGYEQPIREALDHLEKEVPPVADGSRYLLLARQRILALELGRLQEAYDGCMRELDLAASDKDQSRAVHFATFTYCALCHLAGTVGDWKTLDEWSGTGEKLAREVGHECELSEVLAWQAVAARQLGDQERARRAFQAATGHMGRLQMPPKQPYYDALVQYHEWAGDLDRALAVRDAELKAITDKGRLLYECRVRLKRCVLLARLGRLREPDLVAAREAARKLRRPENYLAQVDRLAGAAAPPRGPAPP